MSEAVAIMTGAVPGDVQQMLGEAAS